MTLEQVLADAREEIATLKRYGQADVAGAVEAILDRLTAELREYLTWHDEKGAALLSGKGVGYFAARFDDWEARGLARSPRRGVRQYRETVIPKRARISEVQADAERAAREDAA
jgi:hypothetical protein